MRSALFAVALLALTASALASLPLGDNGMTTYTGRKREANTLVFGNQMVVDQGMNAVMELTKQMLTGTWKPTRNDPATEKKDVGIFDAFTRGIGESTSRGLQQCLLLWARFSNCLGLVQHLTCCCCSSFH